MSEHSAREQARAPDQVGSHRVGALLARGDSSDVYFVEGEDPRGPPLVLKLAHARSSEVLAAFRRELRALTVLDHPGVVKCCDWGRHEGYPWLVMPQVDGPSLQHLLGRWWGRLQASPEPELEPESVRDAPAGAALVAASTPPAPARSLAAAGKLQTFVALMKQLCEVLAHLHQQGFVHGDLSPSNILIAPGGRVVLVDFGLVTRFSAPRGREILDTWAGGGSPTTMAPEVIRGEEPDPRADLYAVGCLLYEGLVGRPPFQSLQQHIHRVPDRPSRWVREVPPPLDQLVARLLVKDRLARCLHAEDVAAQLAEVLGEPASRSASGSRQYLYRPRIAGREAEVERLTGALLQPEGPVHLAVVRAESGAGKTRLLTRVMEEAWEAGWRVSVGICAAPAGAGEASLAGGPERILHGAPLHPLRTLLAAVADHCEAHGVAETARVLGDRAAVLARHQPLLAQLPGVIASAEPEPLLTDTARNRLYRYLATTLEAYCRERPVLLALDDLQWSDELTLGFLAGVLDRRWPVPNFKVIASLRVEEPMPDVQALLGSQAVLDLRLPPLAPEALGQMISDMLGATEAPPELTGWIVKHSGGNPLFALEYLQTVVEKGALRRQAHGGWVSAPPHAFEATSQAVEQVIERRLERLSPYAGALADLAAVSGSGVDGDILHHAFARKDVVFWRALEELSSRQVLREENERIVFTHDKLREVLYRKLVPPRRATLHRRLAEAWESRLGSGPEGGAQGVPKEIRDSDVLALAEHWNAADEPARAAVYYERAAEMALASGAYRQARELLRWAWEEGRAPWERARLARLRGEVSYALGKLAEAVGELEHGLAVVGYAMADRAQQRRQLLMGFWALLWRRWVPPGGELREAELSTWNEASLAARLLSITSSLINEPLRQIAATILAARLAYRVDAFAPVATSFASAGTLTAFIGLGGWSRHFFGRAYANAERSGRGLAQVLLSELFVTAVKVCDWPRTLELGKRGLAAAEQTGDAYVWELCSMFLSLAAHHLGDGEASARYAAQMYRSASTREHGLHQLFAQNTRAEVAWRSGRLDELGELVRWFQQAGAHSAGNLGHAAATLAWEAAYCEGRGELGRALEASRGALELMGHGQAVTPLLASPLQRAVSAYITVLGSEAERGREQRVAVEMTLRRLSGMARRFPAGRGMALIAWGRWQGVCGRPARARRCFAKALAEAERWHLPWDRAVAHAYLSATYPSGSPEAEDHLHQARVGFDQVGAPDHLRVLQPLLVHFVSP